jgi:hypothetical protein
MMAAVATAVAVAVVVVVDRLVAAGTGLGRRVRRHFTEEAGGQEGVAGIGRAAETLAGAVISMAATSATVVVAGMAPARGTVTISGGGIIVTSASLCLPLVTPSGATTRAGGAAHGGMTTASINYGY